MFRNEYRNVLFYQNALGKVDGQRLVMNIQKKLGNSSLLRNLKKNYKSNIIEKKKLKLQKLDTLLMNKKNLDSIGIKIDVEGFEMNVLKGSSDILENKNLKAVIIEINGSGRKYGVEDFEIHDFLKKFAFIPFTYNPFKRELIELVKYTNHNTIYIRDQEYCINRCKNAASFSLHNGMIF